MKSIKYLLTVVMTLVLIPFIEAQDVTSSPGGSIQTFLSAGIIVNENSSLTREWITIHDDNLPIDIVGTVGITTIYEDGGRYSSGGYRYYTLYEVTAKEDIVALEINFITFNIWGEKVKTLSATEIIDIAAGSNKKLNGTWNVSSENEVSEFYASIAYIAQVRTKSGKVYKANPTLIIRQAQKYSSKFSESDLEEKK